MTIFAKKTFQPLVFNALPVYFVTASGAIKTKMMPLPVPECQIQFDNMMSIHYRATLCVSAVFAVAMCLWSVRPSVTLVYCIHTVEDIVFLDPVAP